MASINDVLARNRAEQNTDTPRGERSTQSGQSPGVALQTPEQKRAAIEPILSRMRTGDHWVKPKGKNPSHQKSPLSEGRIAEHLKGGDAQRVGLCPMQRGSSTTRIALLDLDDHAKNLPPETMNAKARELIAAGAERGIRFVPFKSSGGHGLHLYVIWSEDQDARSVRAALVEVLKDCGLRNGTNGGIAGGVAEVFPKSDAVPADGWGVMWILPLTGKSVPLDPETLKPIEIGAIDWPESDPVPIEPPAPPIVRTEYDAPELKRVQSALFSVNPNDLDYGGNAGSIGWIEMLFSVHDATEGSADGLAIFLEWSSQWSGFTDESREHTVKNWNAAKPGKGVTAGTLFHLAGKADRVPNADGFPRYDVFGVDVEEAAQRLRATYIVGDWTDEDVALMSGDVIDELEKIDEDIAREARGARKAWAAAQTVVDQMKAGAAGAAFEYRAFGQITERPPEQAWVWDQWLPRGHVTTLFGRGGVGKTLLAQQIATHVALGVPLLGSAVARGPTLAFFCEDDGETLDRRQWDICRAMDEPIESIDGVVLVESRLGKDNVLATFNRERLATPTALLRAIDEEAALRRPVLVIIDNISQVFTGDPNSAGEVTRFVNLLAGIARRHNCAVLVLGHVARGEGSEFAGSAAWENAVRSRLLFQRDGEDPDRVRIARAKANYASLGDTTVRYQQGYFAEFTAEQQAQEKRDAADDLRPLLLEAAEKLVAGGRRLSASNRSASGYLPKLAEEDGLIPKGSTGKGTGPADVALRSLIKAGDLVTIRLPWKINRKHEEGLVPARFRWLEPVIDAAGVVAVLKPEQIAKTAIEAEGLTGDEKALRDALRAVAEAIRRGLLQRAENGCISATGITPLPSVPIGPDDFGYLPPEEEE